LASIISVVASAWRLAHVFILSRRLNPFSFLILVIFVAIVESNSFFTLP
jgi:hypothetical protein